MRRWFSYTMLFVLCCTFLSGCGGGGCARPAATGRVSFSIVWPTPSRLLPTAASSITVTLTKGTQTLASRVVARPVGGGTIIATFDLLPLGDLIATVKAFPSTNGTGVAQAQASVIVTIAADVVTPIHLTMASTIDHLEVSPTNPSLRAGDNIPLIATAKDASGNVVLTSASKLQWQTSDAAIATVDTAGQLAARDIGSVTITLTELESGKTITLPITIGPPISLVSWWKAEGTAQDSIGGNHGTAHNGVSYGPGHKGQAFVFDGVNAAISVPDADSLKLTDALTIDTWVKANSIPPPSRNYAMICFRGDSRLSHDPYFLGIQFDGNLHFAFDDVNDIRTEIAAPMPLGRWVHITALFDSVAGWIRLYLDGTVVAEAQTFRKPLKDLDPNAFPGVGIGNHSGFPNTPYNYPFNGSIDELRIYNKAVPPLP